MENTFAIAFEKVDLQRMVRQDGKVVSLSVLNGIDLSVERGQSVAVLGPSGTGKSSLLRLVNRLDDATNGTIRVLGKDVRSIDVLELRRKASLVLQKPVLFEGTVADNINWPVKLAGEHALDRPAIEQLLQRAQLDPGLATRYASELSVGQQQRVCLARALALKPEILMLDETTAALDPPVAQALLRGLKQNSANGLTVLHITHDPAKLRIADRLIMLSNGSIAVDGNAGRLLDDPPPELARFLSQEEE